mgnify:CR=1 FL=1
MNKGGTKNMPNIHTNPHLTCAKCSRSWTLHGTIDLDDTSHNWSCPFCQTMLRIKQTKEEDE